MSSSNHLINWCIIIMLSFTLTHRGLILQKNLVMCIYIIAVLFAIIVIIITIITAIYRDEQSPCTGMGAL